MTRTPHIVPPKDLIKQQEREAGQGHRAALFWLTGLPCSGKTTLLRLAERRLFEAGYSVYGMDGDEFRASVSADLGFSEESRTENIRRAAEVSRILMRSGQIVIAAFISPMRAQRALARSITGDSFHEVFVRADVETCAARDPKGHYKLAMQSQLPNFTGVSAPYEQPDAPSLIVDTNVNTVEESVAALVDYISSECPLK